jgi:hypothetical protein
MAYLIHIFKFCKALYVSQLSRKSLFRPCKFKICGSNMNEFVCPIYLDCFCLEYSIISCLHTGKINMGHIWHCICRIFQYISSACLLLLDISPFIGIQKLGYAQSICITAYWPNMLIYQFQYFKYNKGLLIHMQWSYIGHHLPCTIPWARGLNLDLLCLT